MSLTPTSSISVKDYTPSVNTSNKTKIDPKIQTTQTPLVAKTPVTQITPKDTAEIKTKAPNPPTQKLSTPVNTNVSNLIANGLTSKQSTEIRPTGATEFSKEITKKVISEAEKQGKSLFPNNKKAAADAAWGWALEQRNKDPKDVNWAAAEHYLYAKSTSMESKVDGVTMGVLAAGYDVVKAGLFAVGKEEWLSTTGKKEDISKPTLGSAISGIQGAIDGFSD
jgi:hypothetical protein